METQKEHAFLSQSVEVNFVRVEFSAKGAKSAFKKLQKITAGKSFRLVIATLSDDLVIWRWEHDPKAVENQFTNTGWWRSGWKRIRFVDVVVSVTSKGFPRLT